MSYRKRIVKQGGKYGAGVGMVVGSAYGAMTLNPLIFSGGAITGGLAGRSIGKRIAKAYADDLYESRQDKKALKRLWNVV